MKKIIQWLLVFLFTAAYWATIYFHEEQVYHAVGKFVCWLLWISLTYWIVCKAIEDKHEFDCYKCEYHGAVSNHAHCVSCRHGSNFVKVSNELEEGDNNV